MGSLCSVSGEILFQSHVAVILIIVSELKREAERMENNTAIQIMDLFLLPA